MADRDTPNRQSNMEKAEGDRWSSEQDTVRNADRNRGSDIDSSDEGGGISNRSLDDEIINQNAVPERGMSQEDEPRRGRSRSSHEDTERGIEDEDIDR